jgi:hypothetical protein
VGVVAPEVPEEFGVLVHPQELADSEVLTIEVVGERGRWSTRSEAPEVCELVVYEAKDGDDEGAPRSTRAETSF